MEWLLSLVLQLVSVSDDFSQATMNKPLKAVIQEHAVCREDLNIMKRNSKRQCGSKTQG